MECSCVIDVYDGDHESVDCQTIKLQKARKTHKCHECYQPILPGDIYEHARYLCAGRWWRHKTCPDCLSLREQFMASSWAYEVLREYITEHIREVDGELPESCISALTPRARAWVCGEIEWVWDDREYDDELLGNS